MTPNTSLEERLAAVEAAIAELQKQVATPQATNWLQQIRGYFIDEPAFDEVIAEEQLAAVEAAIAELQKQVATPQATNWLQQIRGSFPQATNWLQQIRGSFKDEPAFDEVIPEEQLAALKAAIDECLKQVATPQATNWLQQITGSFKDEPAFDEVIAYGRAIRQADESILEPQDEL